MREGLPYTEWKKELNIWCAFTDMKKERQGGALFLTLTGRARQSILADVKTETLSTDTGVTVITDALDKLFLKDQSQAGFTAFDEFIKYRRPGDTNISEYLLEFNLKYGKIKCYDMTLPDGVLAYALLTCANLPADQEQICRATVTKLTYADMKLQIEKVVVCKEPTKDVCKIEPQFYNDDSYYADDDQYEQFQEPEYAVEDDYNVDTYYTRQGNRPSDREDHSNRPPQRLNPSDEFGNPTPCRFCHSVYHWIDRCPDAPKKSSRGRFQRRPFRGRGRSNYGNYRQPARPL